MLKDRALLAALRSASGFRLLGASLLLVGYVGVGVFDHELWPPTEQAMAGVAWEMYHSGELAIPQINGMPYLEKPPLAYLLSWAAFVLGGGPSAGLLRLPAALAGVACVLIVFGASRRLYGEATAWACALMCALTANFWIITHRASTDSIAMLSTFACLALFLRTLPRPVNAGADESSVPSPPRADWRVDLPFCLALALSFYVKNFFTLLLVLPPAVLTLVATRDYRRLVLLSLWLVVLLAGVLAPWCWVLYSKGGWEYLRIVFFDNTLGRFTNVGPPSGAVLAPLNDAFVVGKGSSPTMVLSAFPQQMLPWVVLQPVAIWAFFRRRAAEPWRLFLKIALISILTVLTLSASRTESYYRPVIFVLCLMTGEYIRSAYGAEPSNVARRVIELNWLLAALLIVLLPLGAALVLAVPTLGWLALPSAALFATVWHASRLRWARRATPLAWGALCALVAAMDAAVLIPPIDEARAWRPFFDALQDGLDESRKLSTSILDDSRLPAINFYLDRRIDTISPDRVPSLLRSREDVGVIVSVNEYELLQPALASIPHREVRAPSGEERYVYLDNGPAAVADVRSLDPDSRLAGLGGPPSAVDSAARRPKTPMNCLPPPLGDRPCPTHGWRRWRWRSGAPRQP